jgi:heme exporter protein D
MTLLNDLLRAILSLLTSRVGPFGMAQVVFFLAGVWAMERIRLPLQAAGDDLRAVRADFTLPAGCPEEIIAAERMRNLRVRLAGAVWIALTGLLYLLPGTRWPPVAGQTFRLFTGVWLTVGLLGAALAMGVMATATERTRVRLNQAIAQRVAQIREREREREQAHAAQHLPLKPPPPQEGG